ncbi:MAG: hypothetical protein LRY32_01220 [Flavobacterium sp.]|nr:hypothetical protein [Flavobacterium sp.]
MKKLLLVLGVGALLSLGLSSCSKCAECSDSGTSLDGVEYCKGNSLEDAAYAYAESECENNGGKFK